jgi:deoxycytidylate deaminase
MSSPKKWMKICTDLACTSSSYGFGKRSSKHGAVIVKNGRIIGVGINTMRANASVEASENSWRSSYVHAEEVALKMAGSRASGSTLYVSRVNKSGNPRLSEPCIKCERMINRYGVKRVVYTETEC